MFGFPRSEFDDESEFRLVSVGPGRNPELRGLTCRVRDFRKPSLKSKAAQSFGPCRVGPGMFGCLPQLEWIMYQHTWANHLRLEILQSMHEICNTLQGGDVIGRHTNAFPVIFGTNISIGAGCISRLEWEANFEELGAHPY